MNTNRGTQMGIHRWSCSALITPPKEPLRVEGPSWGRELWTCCCRTSWRRVREWRTSCRRRRRRRLGSSSTELASTDANKLRTLRLLSQTDGQTDRQKRLRFAHGSKKVCYASLDFWSDPNRTATINTFFGVFLVAAPFWVCCFQVLLRASLSLSLSLSSPTVNNPTHRREKQ
jgi:hypothetical protein